MTGCVFRSCQRTSSRLSTERKVTAGWSRKRYACRQTVARWSSNQIVPHPDIIDPGHESGVGFPPIPAIQSMPDRARDARLILAESRPSAFDRRGGFAAVSSAEASTASDPSSDARERILHQGCARCAGGTSFPLLQRDWRNTRLLASYVSLPTHGAAIQVVRTRLAIDCQ